MTLIHKRFHSLILVFIISLVAVAGLLLGMGRLAAPVAAPTQPDQPQVESQPPAMAEAVDEEMVATVNNKIITRQVWQQVTRLDMVMSRLASQPLPTAEETLDRLVNEIIVLEADQERSAPTDAEIETRISSLLSAWNVGEAQVAAALAEAGLDRADLIERMGRLIQVEAALDQLRAQEADLDAWLAQARVSAEISLYRSLDYTTADRRPLTADESLNNGVPPQVSTNPQNIAEAASLEGAIGPVSQEAASDQTGFAPPVDLPVAPYVDNAAPDFSLPQLNGGPLTLSSFRGKPTIINFWASWCPPCRRELPALQAAYLAHQDEIGFVAVDVKEDVAAVAAFVSELGLSFPVVLDQDGAVSDVAYEVRGLPTTLFVDAAGVVTARHIGPLDEISIDSYLKPLLAPEPDAVQPLAPAVDGQPTAVDSPTSEETKSDQPALPQPAADLPLAPDFTSAAADGSAISLQDYRDKNNVVLVFYRGHT